MLHELCSLLFLSVFLCTQRTAFSIRMLDYSKQKCQLVMLFLCVCVHHILRCGRGTKVAVRVSLFLINKSVALTVLLYRIHGGQHIQTARVLLVVRLLHIIRKVYVECYGCINGFVTPFVCVQMPPPEYELMNSNKKYIWKGNQRKQKCE